MTGRVLGVLATTIVIGCLLVGTYSASVNVRVEQTPTLPEGIYLDLDEIFPPPQEMRDLVILVCTNCHTVTPIVVLQMDGAQWKMNAATHRAYVPALSDKDFKDLYEYLMANFNPERPVPRLPPELLETWTWNAY
jgi:hypothetical protein